MIVYDNLICKLNTKDKELMKKYNISNVIFPKTKSQTKTKYYRLRRMVTFPEPRFKFPYTKYDLEISFLLYKNGTVKSIVRNRTDYGEFDYVEIINENNKKQSTRLMAAKITEDQVNLLIEELIKENILVRKE